MLGARRWPCRVVQCGCIGAGRHGAGLRIEGGELLAAEDGR